MKKVYDCNCREGATIPSESEWVEQRESDDESYIEGDISPSPPPPELPSLGEPVSQELFLA